MTASPSFDSTAHKLLEELDVRHEQLLAELDQLSARVEAVLSQYTKITPAPQPDSPSEPLDEADEDEEE